MVLHLCGSRVSEYYEGVSTYYASQCWEEVVKKGTYDHAIVMVHLDGKWSYPKDFSEEAAKAAERMDVAKAVARILELKPAVLVPHMFCLPGMTSHRAMFDVLGIPLVGCDAGVMALSTNKAQSRAVVEAAGVRVPEAEILHKGDKPKMLPPFILKPCNEDNSMGVTLFTGKDKQDLDKALATAFEFDSEVLCERYIPLGREVRVAVLEMDDGSLKLLPCLEYFLPAEMPIRTSADKLQTNARGVPTQPTSGNRKCPADIEPELRAKLQDLAERSHRALGCRDYSLYDVRIDPEGQPYFLEGDTDCGHLHARGRPFAVGEIQQAMHRRYCSFAPRSVIVSMAAQLEPKMEQSEIFEMLVHRTIERRRKAAESTQLLGMKAAV